LNLHQKLISSASFLKNVVINSIIGVLPPRRIGKWLNVIPVCRSHYISDVAEGILNTTSSVEFGLRLKAISSSVQISV